MMNQFKTFAAAVLSAVLFAACSDSDEGGFNIRNIDASGNVLVVCQGNQGVKLPGTLDLYSASQDTLLSSVFRAVNGADLGFSPQNAVVLGQRIYTAVFDENMLLVTDKNSLALVDTLRVEQPQCVAAADGYVYVACNDGYVCRINPQSGEQQRLAVGPNPAGLAVSGDYLYVSISDGYNYSNNYANGLRVSRISMTDFKVDKEIGVGLNPGQMAVAADGNVFVVCNGNYADVHPEVWRIAADGEAKRFCSGSLVAAAASGVYVINSVTDWSDWQNPVTTTDCALYTADGALLTDFALSEIPPQPTAIALSPEADRLYVVSDYAVGDFTSPGWLYVFTPEGRLISRKATGVHPFALLFVRGK